MNTTPLFRWGIAPACVAIAALSCSLQITGLNDGNGSDGNARPDAAIGADVSLVADGEDAGAAVDAAPTETFVMPDAAPYDPNDGNGSVGDGMAPDAVDTGASDPETGPDVSSCDELFGDAEEYFYCEETQTSCTFSARTGGTCADLCASYGAACLRAWDNANDPGADVCASIGDDQCSTRRTTEICKCERISSN